MPIATTCPHCRTRIHYESDRAGLFDTCPRCRQLIQLPSLPAKEPHWFLARGKQKLGPFTWQQLTQMARSGMLSPEDMLLAEGEQKWLKANAIGGLWTRPIPPAIPFLDPKPPKVAQVQANRPNQRRVSPRVNMRVFVASVVCLGIASCVGGLIIVLRSHPQSPVVRVLREKERVFGEWENWGREMKLLNNRIEALKTRPLLREEEGRMTLNQDTIKEQQEIERCRRELESKSSKILADIKGVLRELRSIDPAEADRAAAELDRINQMIRGGR